MELQEKVKDLVSCLLKIDRSKIGEQTNFFTELGADSLEMLSFVTALENEFKVSIGGQELDTFYCVENIVKFLKNNNGKTA